MEALVIIAAFVLGFLARQLKLPPMIGFLAAGFALFALGYEKTDTLQWIADVGVSLLLFSIGLKLRIRNLLSPVVWAGATIHMIATVAVLGLAVYGLTLARFSSFEGLTPRLALLIAFALSFSSTVFAVKIQEEKGEASARHSRIAIGILVVQDIFAVVFITASKGQLPSPWAFAFLLLPLLRPLLRQIMVRSGHGEVLVLFGIMYALAVSQAFEFVHLKADLGALVAGALLAGHPKADELSKALLGFKDLFLVAFFLTVGLSGTPTPTTVGIALLFVLAIPVKAALFLFLLTRFKLRARTSLLGSLSLATYSEFGLIVVATGTAAGWISADWLLILAVATSISFVMASPMNVAGDRLWARYRDWLVPWQSQARLPGDEPVDFGDAELVVVGMGRLGSGAYDCVRDRLKIPIIGVDRDERVVRKHVAAGRDVVLADATDLDVWEETVGRGRLRSVLIALPDFEAQCRVAENLSGRPVFTAATVQHEDEVQTLKDAGIDAVFNHYSEAGNGFAAHAVEAYTGRVTENGGDLDD